MKLLSGIAASTALVMSLSATAVQAQALKFSTVGGANDPDAVAMRVWEEYIEANSELEVDVFDSASLVEQGKQGQALGRGTIDAAYMPPAWISEQVPSWGVLDTPYLLTSPAHICAFGQSDLMTQMVTEVEDAMSLRLLGTAYQGTRTLNLREQRDVQTPADMNGLSLRVVPSPANILMGEGLGANPTPVPFSELYLALQTGTVDAQENPLTLIHSQKFYEVTEQIVTTNHKVLIQFPAFSSRTWARLSPEEQTVVAEGAVVAMDAYTQNVIDLEASLRATLEAEGLVFTDPDRDAFRTAVLDTFQNSELAADWEEGVFSTIADMEIPAECAAATN